MFSRFGFETALSRMRPGDEALNAEAIDVNVLDDKEEQQFPLSRVGRSRSHAHVSPL